MIKLPRCNCSNLLLNFVTNELFWKQCLQSEMLISTYVHKQAINILAGIIHAPLHALAGQQVRKAIIAKSMTGT